MTQQTLFPESQETRTGRLDAEISNLIIGHSGGPLGLHMEDAERSVLRAIRNHRGISQAVTIASIQEQTGLSPRSIKEAVRTLRINYHLPVGSSKNAGGGGYFLMVSEEDRNVWVKDVRDQIRAELAVLRAAAGHQAMLELLGQLQMEVI